MSESYHAPQAPGNNPRNKYKNRSTPEGYKFCPACEQEKPLDDFFLRNGKHVGACKECVRERDRERNKARRPRKTPIIPDATQEGYKVCSTCLIEKPYAEFVIDATKKDGYKSRCKQCYREQYAALPEGEKEVLRMQDRMRRLPRIEQRRAYDRKRHNTDEHRARRRAINAVRR